MSNILKIFIFFLLLITSTLKSNNMTAEYFTLTDNKLPGSRLLIDSQPEIIEKKIQTKKQNKNILKKKKQEKVEIKRKLNLQENYKLEISFMPDKEKPTVEEIKVFYDNLLKFNKKDSIIIKGYAQKRKNDSTSTVRRLSLKRALFLRSLFLKENYNISKIYVKALGHDHQLIGNKDIVVITNN